MPPTPVAAFTDYPDCITRPVTVLSFDGNKYATLRHADGREESVKAGYVFADAAKTRRLNRVQLHVLAGGSRKDYKRRARKTTYRLLSSDGYDAQPRAYEDLDFDSKAAAVYAAAREAAALDEDIFVMATVQAHNKTCINCREIVVTPQGLAYELRRRRHQKYLRGYGKR